MAFLFMTLRKFIRRLEISLRGLILSLGRLLSRVPGPGLGLGTGGREMLLVGDGSPKFVCLGVFIRGMWEGGLGLLQGVGMGRSGFGEQGGVGLVKA